MCGKLIVHHTLEHIAEEVLHQTQDIVTFDKTHLKIQLCELELSVSSGVLITVTACNLEVLVKSADHQKLLVELRALRQGVELSGILS